MAGGCWERYKSLVGFPTSAMFSVFPQISSSLLQPKCSCCLHISQIFANHLFSAVKFFRLFCCVYALLLDDCYLICFVSQSSHISC